MKRPRNADAGGGPVRKQPAQPAKRNSPAANSRDARRFALRVQLLELERMAAVATTLAEQRRLYAQMSALRHALHALQ